MGKEALQEEEGLQVEEGACHWDIRKKKQEVEVVDEQLTLRGRDDTEETSVEVAGKREEEGKTWRLKKTVSGQPRRLDSDREKQKMRKKRQREAA